MNGPQIAFLADGRRLHCHHGPIDLIVEAFGDEDEKRAAYAQAVQRFETVLTELVEELTELRAPPIRARVFKETTAQRMENAISPFAPEFITPMAAVAGSVADEVLTAMATGRDLRRAYVNNGGDIALHLAPGEEMRLAIAGTGNGFADRILVRAEGPVRGIATSGWRGRSHSLGIADAVTVLAKTAAAADAAATMIANAVDLPGHPAVSRAPASSLSPDSDLGERLVTVAVEVLAADEIAQALERGLAAAERYRRRRLIEAAALFLGGDVRVCGGISSESVPLDVAPLCPAGHLPRKGGDQLSLPSQPSAGLSERVAQVRPADLPPCGGDVRQDRGGREGTGAVLSSSQPASRTVEEHPHA